MSTLEGPRGNAVILATIIKLILHDCLVFLSLIAPRARSSGSCVAWDLSMALLVHVIYFKVISSLSLQDRQIGRVNVSSALCCVQWEYRNARDYSAKYPKVCRHSPLPWWLQDRSCFRKPWHLQIRLVGMPRFFWSGWSGSVRSHPESSRTPMDGV